jgi:hypothetical protein
LDFEIGTALFQVLGDKIRTVICIQCTCSHHCGHMWEEILPHPSLIRFNLHHASPERVLRPGGSSCHDGP